MVMGKTLPLANLKAHLSEIVDQVESAHNRVILTRDTPGTVERVTAACHEAGLDMGLYKSRNASDSLLLRERGRMLTWPTELRVSVAPGTEGETAVTLVGSCWGYYGARQRAYLTRLVEAFASRLTQELEEPRATPVDLRRRQRLRLALGGLKALTMGSIGLLVVVAWVVVLWKGQLSQLAPLMLMSDFLVFGAAPAADHWRGRMIGTNLPKEPLIVAAYWVAMLAIAVSILV
jgi:hypothetical protein